MAVRLQELPADGNFGLVVDVGAHSIVSLVALAELVVEHAVLLAAGLRFDDRVDAPVLVGGDALPRHRVPTSKQNPGLVLVLDVLFAVEVKLPRDDFWSWFYSWFRDSGRFWSLGRLRFDAVELPAVVGHLITNTLKINAC